MNDYTFERYEDIRETRAWYERFLREHNGSDWRNKLRFPLTDLLTGNTPKSPNGETTKVFWYRIRHKGILIGYTDAKIHPIFNGRKIISDVWIIPRFRNQGHFHLSFPALIKCTSAVGVCIIQPKYELYGGLFESFGFEWIAEYRDNPSAAPDHATLFLVTRDAYKDMVRFMIKYAGNAGHPVSERGRFLYEEVKQELQSEGT